MAIHEIRDSDIARQYLLQGIWLQRLSATTAKSITEPLRCALDLAAADEPIPPLGFVADVLRLVLGGESKVVGNQPVVFTGMSAETIRSYEDYVLGKFYADSTFEQASVAICRYAQDERTKATAWLIARFAERANVGGVVMSPAVARSLLAAPLEDCLLEGSDSLSAEGVMPLLTDGYAHLINRTRSVGEVLALEDVFELEHGTALAEFGQRLALRQIVRVAGEFESSIPRKPPRPSRRSSEVPTHILDEDTYPVGGFTSISTRGSIESLLHSELAYMETDKALQPDLFDIKFQRSELLYYSRDENEFLRRRRTFQFALHPDLVDCRVKDEGMDYQRMILTWGLLVATIKKLIEWLSDDALSFEIAFIMCGKKMPLHDEQNLLEMILSEQIANGTVNVCQISASELTSRAEESARSSFTHVLSVSSQQQKGSFDQAIHTVLQVSAPLPTLQFSYGGQTEVLAVDSWASCIEKILSEFC